jgi:hypothetical protein
MGGVYFKMAKDPDTEQQKITLTGFVRLSGGLEVLGLIAISAEFLMELTYADGVLSGAATLTVEIDIAFFSKSVELHVERQFAGSSNSGAAHTALLGIELGQSQPATPTFVDLMMKEHWAAYCAAFEDPASV